MTEISLQPEIRDGSGDLLFRLADAGRANLPTSFLFSLPKAGSTLFYEIAKDLCQAAGVTYVSFPDHFFALGIPEVTLPAECSRAVLETGYCYGGFRMYPKQCAFPFIRDHKKILLVRDPRDMLVSNYYSTAFSHTPPGEEIGSDYKRNFLDGREKAQQKSVNKYVVEVACEYKSFISSYDEVMEMNNIKVMRYEDYIYNKMSLVNEVVEFFEWPIGKDRIAQIAANNDVIPEAEDKKAHIRQVHPGNYKKKLAAETIEQLNSLFEPELKKFNYEF